MPLNRFIALKDCADLLAVVPLLWMYACMLLGRWEVRQGWGGEAACSWERGLWPS